MQQTKQAVNMKYTISMTEAASYADVERCTILRWIRKYSDLATMENGRYKVDVKRLNQIIIARETLAVVADVK